MNGMDEVFERARDLADAAGKKTGEWVSLAKLKWEWNENERVLGETLKRIGCLVYKAARGGASAEEELNALLEEVDALRETSRELMQKMDDIRRTRHCRACGKNNPDDAEYCLACGRKL